MPHEPLQRPNRGIHYISRGPLIFFFSAWVFFHGHSRFAGQQGKGEGIYLAPLCHFRPLRGRLGIGRAIAARGSPLRIAGSRTRAGNLWFPGASR